MIIKNIFSSIFCIPTSSSSEQQRLQSLFESIVTEVKATAVRGACNRLEERNQYGTQWNIGSENYHNGYIYKKKQNSWKFKRIPARRLEIVNYQNNSFISKEEREKNENFSAFSSPNKQELLQILGCAYYLEHQRTGQCSDQAAYGAYLLWELVHRKSEIYQLIDRVELCSLSKLNHLFIMINRKSSAKNDDPTTWGGWIIDCWANEGHRIYPCNPKTIFNDLDQMKKDVIREEIYCLLEKNPKSDVSSYLKKAHFSNDDPLFVDVPDLLKQNQGPFPSKPYRLEVNASLHSGLMRRLAPPNLRSIEIISKLDEYFRLNIQNTNCTSLLPHQLYDEKLLKMLEDVNEKREKPYNVNVPKQVLYHHIKPLEQNQKLLLEIKNRKPSFR